MDTKNDETEANLLSVILPTFTPRAPVGRLTQLLGKLPGIDMKIPVQRFEILVSGDAFKFQRVGIDLRQPRCRNMP